MADLEAPMNIHARIAQSHEKLRRGLVHCHSCGGQAHINGKAAIWFGWPKCCGYTMSLDTPEERRALIAKKEANNG